MSKELNHTPEAAKKWLPEPESGDAIPFNRAFIVGKELYYISQAVLRGQLAGDGQFSHLCAAWMEERFRVNRVLLTHSCTAALEMAALLCDISPGDEVIMPSYTFVSTANAFALRGAKIRFVDIREDTLNMDESKIEEAITSKTKLIVPVHYAGVACEMDSIMEIASAHGLRVVEDAAQGVNASYRGRYLGSIGDLGCYSFHETKNFISGEGGALAVNDPELVERAEIVREKGTNRSLFVAGKVDKYSWVDLGSSFLPGELTAAFLYAQLEASERITDRRQAVCSYYQDALLPLAQRGYIRLPFAPDYCEHNAHMFYLVTSSPEVRTRLIAHLAERNIQGIFHYVPLHSSPMGKELGLDDVDLPITDSLSARLLRLPCFFELSGEQQNRVISAIYSFYCPDFEN